MAEDNPQISVDFLKQNYPGLSEELEDEDLQSIVQQLGKEMIKTKGALQRVSREALQILVEKKDFPVFALEILKPEEAVAGPIAVAGPPAAGAPPSTPRSRDISNQIAAVFEGEVNMHLEDYFQSVLPGCKFSKFKSREIDDDNAALEMDSFSYMTHDTLEPPQTNKAVGIYVVHPNRMNKKQPKEAPRKLADSPGAKAASLGRHAEKYVVGESYSGDREDRIKGKVHQLEEKLDKMKQRHSIQSSALSDATSLFGAAILSFTCQSLPRKDQSRKCMRAVSEELSFTQTPILWRLAQAERFFIVVLSTREGANTCALREITRGIQGVEIGIQAILGRLDEKAGEEGNEEIGGAEHQY